MELPDRGQLQALYSSAGITANARAKPLLIKAIRQAEIKQHIYIYAPVGFGKTASALRLLKHGDSAWLVLDEKDNHSHMFFTRLAMAFLSLQPNNAVLKGKLRADETYDSSRQLAEDMAYCLCPGAAKAWIVLDSFENITDEGLIRSFVNIVKALPAGFTVMIIDGHEPHELFSDLILRNLMSVVKECSVII